MRKEELWVYAQDLQVGDKVLMTNKPTDGFRVLVERDVPEPRHLVIRTLEHADHVAGAILLDVKEYLGKGGDPNRLVITTSADPSSFRVQILTEGWTKK